jgi:hypothetical protein
LRLQPILHCAYFLERIVTADETWVYRYEPESKAQSGAWKLLTSPVAKKFKSQPSAGKIMLTLFLGYARCDFGSFHSKGSRSTSDFHMFRSRKEEEEDFHPMKKSLARCKIG